MIGFPQTKNIMNKFILEMLRLGSELDKAVSPIQINMVINDAEILYKKHIEQLNVPFVIKVPEPPKPPKDREVHISGKSRTKK